MKKERVLHQGAVIASAVAALFAAGLAGPPTNPAQAADEARCYGINACKGKGACGGKGSSCAGTNTCKGQGWLNVEKGYCTHVENGSLTPIETKQG